MRNFGGSLSRSGSVSVSDMIVGILTGENYWFLYVLFVIMVVARLLRYQYALFGLGFCSFMGAYFIGDDNFILNRLVVHPFYFLIGFWLKRNYESFKSYFLVGSPAYKILLLVLYCGGVYFSSFEILKIHFIPIIGSLIVWSFSFSISKNENCTSTLFSHFGKYSLQYYLNHLRVTFYPLYKYGIPIFHFSILAFLFFVILKILVSYIGLIIEKRFRPLRYMCGLSINMK